MSKVVLWALFAFNCGDWPSQTVLDALDASPRFVKYAVVRAVERSGLHYPDLEFVSYERKHAFRGAMGVFYRRWIGKPLPYPIDPVHGGREVAPAN